jgi:hypothetical protein
VRLVAEGGVIPTHGGAWVVCRLLPRLAAPLTRLGSLLARLDRRHISRLLIRRELEGDDGVVELRNVQGDQLVRLLRDAPDVLRVLFRQQDPEFAWKPLQEKVEE